MPQRGYHLLWETSPLQKQRPLNLPAKAEYAGIFHSSSKTGFPSHLHVIRNISNDSPKLSVHPWEVLYPVK